MNQPDFLALRRAMIDCQLRPTGVSDERVVDAIEAVARERFVPQGRASLAYIDEDIPLGAGRWLTKPMVFARLLNAAPPAAGDRVLLIGAATGYGAAVLARLAGEVIAVESDAGLAGKARDNLVDVSNVTVVEGDLTTGAPDCGPFDLLFIDGEVETLPRSLLDQLRDGGRVAAVVADETGVAQAIAGSVVGGYFGSHAFMEASVKPLPGFKRPRVFVF